MVYCPPCPLTATVQSSVCSGKSLLGGTDASLVGLEKQITNSRRPPSLSSSCDEGRVKGCGLPLTVVQVAHCTIPAPPPPCVYRMVILDVCSYYRCPVDGRKVS